MKYYGMCCVILYNVLNHNSNNIIALLGLLGPMLRGQEGDTIIVTFRNMVDRPCSIHPHGIAYGKQSEGVCADVMNHSMINATVL